MTGESRASSVVAESVEAVTDALGDVDDADFESGEAAGRTLGARAGRELGGVVGRAIGEAVVSGLREGESPREIADDVRRFLVDVLSAVLRDADVDAALSEIRDRATEAAREATEDAEQAPADAETAGEGVADAASPEELRDLQRETLRDLLEVMSYDELQSVAKKVGVKANLDTETMRERIVEEFSGTNAAEDEEGEDGGEDDGE